MATFTTVPTLVTGPGTFNQLGQLARPLGTQALVVTGPHAMQHAGVTTRTQQILTSAGVGFHLFDTVSGETTAHVVDAGRAALRQSACDLVIGIGGGSAMDAAKSIAALADAPAPAAEYAAGRAADAPHPLPCIEIPTTSGSGAEVTPNAVLIDPTAHRKASIRGPGLLPAVALVDPELAITCPPFVTASAGMDALAQAIESYLSIHATPVTEALSLHAAELLLQYLPEAVYSGTNLPAREGCAYAATLAGIALANARLGVVHGLAHPLGIRFHIPHGLCCALLLAPSLRLNRPHGRHKIARLTLLAGDDIETVIDRLVRDFNLAEALAHHPIDAAVFPDIARIALPSGSSKANPKPLTEDDLLAVLNDMKGRYASNN